MTSTNESFTVQQDRLVQMRTHPIVTTGTVTLKHLISALGPQGAMEKDIVEASGRTTASEMRRRHHIVGRT